MHDVLAHSLSALALQLEGARLLARDRGADPEVVAAIERAHHLAAGGLAEARQAIAALRGDELPGPERLAALADAFARALRRDVHARRHRRAARAPLRGAPRAVPDRPGGADERAPPQRRRPRRDRAAIRPTTARRSSSQDFGPGAPVRSAGGPTAGRYGLTGMRERAELLGGRLSAEPTADGFRVELWLPA